MHVVIFFLIAVVGAVVDIGWHHPPVAFTVLRFFLLVTCGLQGVFAFIGHFFKSDEVAQKIGWPAGNPFQKEVAFTNLAFGVMGIMCWWVHGSFWLATIVGRTVFLWGAAYIHFIDMKKHGNFKAYNAGGPFYYDIFGPLIYIALWIWLQMSS